jgi:hypothetical protein
MEKRKYSRDDLQALDPLEVIRRRPHMYLPSGELRRSKLSTQLADEVATVTTGAIGMIRHGLWWIVACEEDWIDKSRGMASVESYLRNVVPFPEYGVNSMHSEVVIRAFAHGMLACTSGDDCIHLVGAAPTEDLKAWVTRSLPHWQRFVAFRLEG